jgi:hypothetical protein
MVNQKFYKKNNLSISVEKPDILAHCTAAKGDTRDVPCACIRLAAHLKIAKPFHGNKAKMKGRVAREKIP